jgi:dUTP pyrophosphatase
MNNTITKPRAVLFLYVNKENTELVELYKTHIDKHNEHIKNTLYPNSGFDIFIPHITVFDAYKSILVNTEIKAEMCSYYNDYVEKNNNNAYYVYPRSSISKTPLIMSNHVGIIDQGYRGYILSSLKSLSNEEYVLEKYTRLLQICHPLLIPFEVVLLTDENQLTNSERGSGGFGSTGIIGSV